MPYGLLRHSFATWKVIGKAKVILIRRNGPRRYYVTDSTAAFRPDFFTIKCKRLKDAVEFARKLCK